MFQTFQIRFLYAVAFTIFLAPFTRALDEDAFPEPIRKYLDEHFSISGPQPGQQAPDFKLYRPDGGFVRGSELWAKKPVLLITGSYSCPIFRESTESRRALREKYGDRVEFVIIYVREAHPAGEPCPYLKPGTSGFRDLTNQKDGVSVHKATSYEDRLANARKCKEALGIKSTMAVDTLDNPVWEAYGSSPNCAYLIAPGGKVIFRQGLFHAPELEPFIKKLLGGK